MRPAAVRNINARKGEAILHAAALLFPKLGFEKTTMDDIALAAGVTKQTVYSHYRSKELLFTKMIDNLCQRAIHSQPVAGIKSKPFEILLLNVGMKVLDLITSADGMAVTRLVIAEAARYPKLARLYYESGTQRIMQLLAEFLDGQNARGVISIPDTQSAAAYFFAMLKGQYFLRMTLGVPPIPSASAKRAHVKEVVVLFMRVYGGKNPLHTKSSL
ncbi:MAG: TetR/AcrR family transcriptional regulator [Rickettsiales bacterium]